MHPVLEHPILVTNYGEMVPRYLRDAVGRVVVRSADSVHPDIKYASHILNLGSPLYDCTATCTLVEQWISGLVKNRVYCDRSVASIYHSGLPEVPQIFFPTSESEIDIHEVNVAIGAMDVCPDPAINTQIQHELKRIGIFPIPLPTTFLPKYFEWAEGEFDIASQPSRIVAQGWASAGHVYRKAAIAPA